VPIAGFVHRFAAVEKLFDLLIQRRNDVVAVRDGECAARTEVVLDVYDDERLFEFMHGQPWF
jgi:hypothetical protein